MIKSKLIYSIVIFITIVQVSIFILFRKDLNKEEIECITEVKNVKYIKDIESELDYINNSTIVSYNKKDNDWIIKYVLKGSKEEVLENLKKLNGYYISDYNLNYDKESISLELELISK